MSAVFGWSDNLRKDIDRARQEEQARLLARAHRRARDEHLTLTPFEDERQALDAGIAALSRCSMGQQFIPRIGQEVLVGFINNDMDQPFVMASLYNGQGEAARPHTGRAKPSC